MDVQHRLDDDCGQHQHGEQFCLLLIFITGESLLVILLLFGFLGWGGAARIVRSESRRLRDAGFVEASRVLGGTDRHVLKTHVLPSVSGVAVSTATQQVPVLLLTEAGLAFLGLEAFDRSRWATSSPAVPSGGTCRCWRSGGSPVRPCSCSC
ncbi:ABC transporter permease subunit [Halolamina sp.]|uniref:ABC transporter permease subunit n=1 Tax=Halolamina sp. TaxID=1940283 RepID=UPI00356A5971